MCQDVVIVFFMLFVELTVQAYKYIDCKLTIMFALTRLKYDVN